MSIFENKHNKSFLPDEITDQSFDIQFKNKDQIRLLFVDDNEVNRLVAKKMLKILGFDTDLVTNGKEALQALEVFDYDLVFMDIQMPEMDGIEATECIRKKEKAKKQTPIIGVTAAYLQDNIEKFLKSGMNDVISKPLKKGDFKMILFKHLDPNSKSTTCTYNLNSIDSDCDPIWDKSVIEELIGDDTEEQIEFIKIFLDEIVEQIGALEKAISSENLTEINLKSHRIKGSSGDIGAVRIHKISAKIEEYSEQKVLEPCLEQWTLFKKEAEFLIEVLKNAL